MNDQAKKTIRVNSPAEMLSVVPSLLGFAPTDSLVVVGVLPPRNQVQVTLRYDLISPDSPVDLVAHALGVLTTHDIPGLYAAIYGTSEAAAPVATALLDATKSIGFAVTDIVRVEGDRYWSYVCENPECCPPEGTPFGLVAGLAEQFGVPVLARREELAASIAPVTGKEADAMRRATQATTEWLGRHRYAAPNYGINTIHEVLERYREGGDPYIANHDVATISVGLRNLRVRDDAWSRMDPEHVKVHTKLWTEVTRRAQPEFVAAPASLLAFCAWQDGNGALANVALDRALADDPNYSMAQLLRQVIAAGAPPSLARLPMTPEEVAASYEGREEDEPDDAEPADVPEAEE